jgi:hypothetical protein
MHIIGFGSKKDVEKVEERVKELSQKCECKISYDGLLSGEDYIRYIQSCHIGLSPHISRQHLMKHPFHQRRYLIFQMVCR